MENNITEILNRLKTEYADAKIELVFSNNLELAIATILSAQCTDVRVNIVTADLFQKYKAPADYLAVPQTELEDDIRTTGFFRNKAKNIQGFCDGILNRFDGKIPQTMAELTSLPGVGRKTANVILGNGFGIPGMVVDTHVRRISNRLGLTVENDPVKIEKDLSKVIPQDMWILTSHLFIFHGRRTCIARNPRCHNCCVFEFCVWDGKHEQKIRGKHR
ncbi:endonuclease III [bacterium]|nr:endonuclease III [bacterium]